MPASHPHLVRAWSSWRGRSRLNAGEESEGKPAVSGFSGQPQGCLEGQDGVLAAEANDRLEAARLAARPSGRSGGRVPNPCLSSSSSNSTQPTCTGHLQPHATNRNPLGEQAEAEGAGALAVPAVAGRLPRPAACTGRAGPPGEPGCPPGQCGAGPRARCVWQPAGFPGPRPSCSSLSWAAGSVGRGARRAGTLTVPAPPLPPAAACFAARASPPSWRLSAMPPPQRHLAEEEDGVCDPERRNEDPDCGGATAPTICAANAGMAAAAGLGACLDPPDAGCFSILPGQLDIDCAGVMPLINGQAPAGACSEACRATVSRVGGLEERPAAAQARGAPQPNNLRGCAGACRLAPPAGTTCWRGRLASTQCSSSGASRSFGSGAPPRMQCVLTGRRPAAAERVCTHLQCACPLLPASAGAACLAPAAWTAAAAARCRPSRRQRPPSPRRVEMEGAAGRSRACTCRSVRKRLRRQRRCAGRPAGAPPWGGTMHPALLRCASLGSPLRPHASNHLSARCLACCRLGWRLPAATTRGAPASALMSWTPSAPTRLPTAPPPAPTHATPRCQR